MTTFNFGKGADDIQQAELLPDDWYRLRIVKPPMLVPNKKKKANMSEEDGARDNIVINFRVTHDNPAWSGRPFTKWLPVPNETDSERFDDFTGMKMDEKLLDVVYKWAAAFNEGKGFEEKQVDFEPGSEALVYIITQLDNREGHENDDPTNGIDMNGIPKVIE
jgi:hypothetical protein